jgi:hypothetical protein
MLFSIQALVTVLVRFQSIFIQTFMPILDASARCASESGPWLPRDRWPRGGTEEGSLTQVRVLWWQTIVRNESDDWILTVHHRPTTWLRPRGLCESGVLASARCAPQHSGGPRVRHFFIPLSSVNCLAPYQGKPIASLPSHSLAPPLARPFLTHSPPSRRAVAIRAWRCLGFRRPRCLHTPATGAEFDEA